MFPLRLPCCESSSGHQRRQLSYPRPGGFWIGTLYSTSPIIGDLKQCSVWGCLHIAVVWSWKCWWVVPLCSLSLATNVCREEITRGCGQASVSSALMGESAPFPAQAEWIRELTPQPARPIELLPVAPPPRKRCCPCSLLNKAPRLLVSWLCPVLLLSENSSHSSVQSPFHSRACPSQVSPGGLPGSLRGRHSLFFHCPHCSRPRVI